ncbi:MAG: RNA polymerase sigma factor [Bacteroidia bacterium]|nr:RNA polymerase sigma factor [Bacteroidia bacterium]
MERRLKALIKDCVKQKAKAQKELYDLFAPKMMSVCMRYVKSEAEAEDILQEGFLKVFLKIKKFQESGSFEAWIRRIMANTAIDFIRKEKHYLHQLEIKDEILPGQKEDIVASLEAEKLMEIIQQLPDGYRWVFNLYAIEGYSHAEIGEKLGISESTSRSQYTRARALLKKQVSHAYLIKHPYKDAI